ncbi:MAG: DUF423 domain-containing protein [Bacilli bacterium]
MAHVWLALGSVLALLAVAFGAFGAHALRKRLTPERMAVYQTGVQYQMYHALAMIATGILGGGYGAWTIAAGWLFVFGVLLFSGSLYLLCLTGRRTFGAITPLGGLALIAGWAALAIGVLR